MNSKIKEIIFRYALLIIIAIPNIYFLQKILFPLTVYPAYFLIKLFFNKAILISNYINFEGLSLQIIPACLAASAYLLLIILNLSTPMGIKKRCVALFFSLLSLLVLNIIRIFALASLKINLPSSFDFTHLATWYFISVIFVVGVWFYSMRIFEIKSMPFADDLKYLYSISNFNKKSKRKRWCLN